MVPYFLLLLKLARSLAVSVKASAVQSFFILGRI
jgi:hypothetical protein